MNYEIINLRKEPLAGGFMPTLKAYLLDTDETDILRPAMVVFPGGGYAYCSPREAERIAVSYNAAGFHAFVLNYPIAPNYRHPEPILAAASAVKTVRENAEKWHINPEQIAIIGFSAGGHLAASLCVHWDNPEIFSSEEIKSAAHKPNASVLSYPVITSGEFAHRGSFNNLLGESSNSHLLEMMSLEKQVKPTTVPAFLWHTYTDADVPVENTLLYAAALSKYKIPCEVHIYPNGSHGLSLVSDETVWSLSRFRRDYDWQRLSVQWLIDLFDIKLH